MTAPDLDWVMPLAGLGPVWGLRRPLEVTWSVPKAPDGPVAVTVRFEPSPSAGGDEAGRGEDVDVVELSSTAAEAARLVSGELVYVFADPKTDVIFKKLFGQKTRRLDLSARVLGGEGRPSFPLDAAEIPVADADHPEAIEQHRQFVVEAGEVVVVHPV